MNSAGQGVQSCREKTCGPTSLNSISTPIISVDNLEGNLTAAVGKGTTRQLLPREVGEHLAARRCGDCTRQCCVTSDFCKLSWKAGQLPSLTVGILLTVRDYSILKELGVLHSCRVKKQEEPFACFETEDIK